MADAQAAPAAFDPDKFAAAIGAAVAAANKPLLEKIGQMETALAKPPASAAAAAPVADGRTADKATTDPAKGVSLEDITKLLDSREKTAREASQTSAARDAFVREHGKGLPPAYLDKLPQTADVGQLAAAEQQLRSQFAADMKAIGVTVPGVSGQQPAAGQTATVGAAVDLTKMSGSQLLAMGVKGQTPTTATPEAIQTNASGLTPAVQAAPPAQK